MESKLKQYRLKSLKDILEEEEKQKNDNGMAEKPKGKVGRRKLKAKK